MKSKKFTDSINYITIQVRPLKLLLLEKSSSPLIYSKNIRMNFEPSE